MGPHYIQDQFSFFLLSFSFLSFLFLPSVPSFSSPLGSFLPSVPSFYPPFGSFLLSSLRFLPFLLLSVPSFYPPFGFFLLSVFSFSPPLFQSKDFFISGAYLRPLPFFSYCGLYPKLSSSFSELLQSLSTFTKVSKNTFFPKNFSRAFLLSEPTFFSATP